jgi:hypothetical protein
MNERSEKPIEQIAKDEATLNFVCRQAQEAILDPNLPASYKDYVLEAALETIQEVAESKAIYYAKHGEGRKTRRPKTIYQAK